MKVEATRAVQRSIRPGLWDFFRRGRIQRHTGEGILDYKVGLGRKLSGIVALATGTYGVIHHLVNQLVWGVWRRPINIFGENIDAVTVHDLLAGAILFTGIVIGLVTKFKSIPAQILLHESRPAGEGSATAAAAPVTPDDLLLPEAGRLAPQPADLAVGVAPTELHPNAAIPVAEPPIGPREWQRRFAEIALERSDLSWKERIQGAHQLLEMAPPAKRAQLKEFIEKAMECYRFEKQLNQQEASALISQVSVLLEIPIDVVEPAVTALIEALPAAERKTQVGISDPALYQVQIFIDNLPKDNPFTGTLAEALDKGDKSLLSDLLLSGRYESDIPEFLRREHLNTYFNAALDALEGVK